MKYILTLLVLTTLFILPTHAETPRGDINGWGTDWMTQDTDFGDVYKVTLTSDTTRASSGFKFDQSGDWVTHWGTGSSHTNATVNSTVGQADISSSGNMTFSETSGKRYTMCLEGTASWWYRPFTIMETDSDPVSIAAVSDSHLGDPATNPVAVTIQLSASKSTQEEIWLRYATNTSFSSGSTLTKASGSSTNYTATIPSYSTGTKVYYYILTSTMPSNRIAAQPDVCTLVGKKDGSDNFSYRVGGGNSWHYPTNAEPSGASMRNPPTNGAPFTANVYFYTGTYTNHSDQTGGSLKYRLVGGSTWSTTNLSWDSNDGSGNQYWKTSIPSDTFAETNEVEYYLTLSYSDEDTTYLGSTDNVGCVKYLVESNAQVNTYTFTYGEGAADLGNCWHNPTNVEPYTATMRNPTTEPATNQTVYIYNGNQYQGAGNIGDQSGGYLFYRLDGIGSWSSNALGYDNVEGNNKYWKSSLPPDTFSASDTVEYYLMVTYTDHDDTYLGTEDGGVSSTTYETSDDAKDNTFTVTYSDEDGQSAAWMWHADNRVAAGDDIQCWVKMGYAEGNGSNRWVDYAAIYYTTNGADPDGGFGSASNASTMVQTMSFSHMEDDDYADGNAMWWSGTLTNLPTFTTIKYQIGAWKTTNDTERFADYSTGTDDEIFSFALGTTGAMALSVSGVNADYTATKFFIDEIAGESDAVVVSFTPGVPDLDKVEIFSNLDRRDYADVDYTNALIAGDGYADGIKPPDGNYITTNDTGAYFTAFPMIHTGGGVYVWTGTVSKCGAYRLTARYTTNNMAANTYEWYTSNGRRDHAIVVSPNKVHEMTMYELNTLTVEATYNDENGRSTFVDLLGSAEGDNDGFDPFNLEYLNDIQANCLWFQPIHPSASTTRGDPSGYTPGSPYAARDYYAVSAQFGSANTEDSALTEFTNFVAECDAYTGTVGTINIMLDGVFNHTAWDAEFGQGGVDLGFCTNVDDRIGWFKPTWYALWTDYGEPATYYQSVYSNDFATAPDRGDFGKWADVCEFYFGKYSALVRNNPADNSDYLNEDDVFDFAGMVTTNEMDLWKYFAYYPEFWLKKTGHSGTNAFVQADDDKGIDGLRCDFGQGLPPQMWEYIINRTRSMKWNFVFMAETLDGGKPGYRSNRHFDVLNESFVFQFTQGHVNDSWDIKSALEDRRSAYSGGTILLNLTSHDEVLPDNDAWLTATRYGAVSTVDGIPMIFYGQEQGIQNYNSDPSYWYYDGFRTDHEENFGKFIPNFKQWNQLMVWSNPPPNNTGLDQWYGRVNWARLNSPALQSPNRYFLSKTGGGDEASIFAVAKYEEAYASPSTSDVVLAFALLFRHSEAHASASATYDLQGAWDTLGLDTNKAYSVRNLASSDASATLWPSNYTGTQLWNDGIYVSLGGGTVNDITDDGELVQYLKIEEANQAPVLTVPGPHILIVGSSTNINVSATDPDGNDVEINNIANPSGSTFNGITFSWTATIYDCGSSNPVVFEADDSQGEDNSIVTNSTYIIVPYDSDTDSLGDCWEWMHFASLTNDPNGDWDDDNVDNRTEFIAGTEPTNSGSLFKVQSIQNSAGQTNFEITVSTEPEKFYTAEFTDDSLTVSPTWSAFSNTADGVGTWTENGESSSTFTFTDDFTTNTTGGEPADGGRVYRIKVETAGEEE